jgi:hypothetical protein
MQITTHMKSRSNQLLASADQKEPKVIKVPKELCEYLKSLNSVRISQSQGKKEKAKGFK